MMEIATIYADGRIQYHGFEHMKSTVRAITKTHVVIHHPGGTYSDNGGKHYVGAHYDVYEYETLRPGNEEGTYIMTFARSGKFVATFHPEKSEAVRAALKKAKELTDAL
jgi:hypothetical protein